MKLAFFAVPALVPGDAVAEVNAFLAAHRVVAVDRELVREPSGAWWALCVSYLGPAVEGPPTRRGKLDYKELLSEADFALYARLRMLRKEIAEREAVPPYALFTNEQLAGMVTGRVRSCNLTPDPSPHHPRTPGRERGATTGPSFPTSPSPGGGFEGGGERGTEGVRSGARP